MKETSCGRQAKHNIETVDLGVPVISMHAPYEIISKADLYETMLAFRAFNVYDGPAPAEE